MSIFTAYISAFIAMYEMFLKFITLEVFNSARQQFYRCFLYNVFQYKQVSEFGGYIAFARLGLLRSISFNALKNLYGLLFK